MKGAPEGAPFSAFRVESDAAEGVNQAADAVGTYRRDGPPTPSLAFAPL